MNIEFTSAHMQTLIELKAIAENHGCRITFGVDSWTFENKPCSFVRSFVRLRRV